MVRSDRSLLLWAGVAGPLLYISVLSFLSVSGEGYNPISTGMSELGAVDSPYRNTMNYLGFSTLGAMIVLTASGLRSYFDIKLAPIALALGGAVMFAVGFLPCDPGCIDVTTVGRWHSLASTVTAILISFSVIMFAMSVTRRFGRGWGYFTFWVGVASLGVGPLMSLSIVEPIVGIVQRAGIGLTLLWIMSISIKVLMNRSARHTTAGSPLSKSHL